MVRFFYVLAACACAACAPPDDMVLPPYAEKGCWAALYEGPGFSGAMRMLEGPAEVESLGAYMAVVPDMRSAGIQPLFEEVRSVQVGPNARLVGYAAPLFREEAVEIARGERVGEAADVGFGTHVRSLKMFCEAQAGSL